MSPKVSLVIPVFNSERYLTDCLNSVLNQKYLNFEVIIINDGSTDDSLSICKKFTQIDSRFRLINVLNGGVSKARNLGILESKGDWICFIDSDDWIGEDFLCNFLTVNPTDDCLIVQEITKVHNKISISAKSYIYKKHEIYDFGKLLLENSLLANGYTVAKLYSKNIIRKHNIQFPGNLIFAEDLVFYLSYLANIKYIQFLESADYFYRIHNESVSFKSFKFDDIILSFSEIKARLNRLINKEYWLNNKEIEKSISMFFVITLYSIYDVNNKVARNKRIELLSSINEKDDLLILRNFVNKYDFPRKYIIRLLSQNKLKRLDFFLLYYVKFDQILIKKLKKYLF